jgi:hypothetical protein
MKSTNKRKGIKFGKVEIPDEDFDPKNVKIRVTAFMDLDLIDALKAEAKESGTKYQTLMNQKLRDSVFGKRVDPELPNLIREIVLDEMRKQSLTKKAV